MPKGLGMCGSEEYLFAMYKALGTIHRGKLNTAQGGCGSQGVLYNPLQGMAIPGQRREDLELLPQILTRTLRDHGGSRERQRLGQPSHNISISHPPC